MSKKVNYISISPFHDRLHDIIGDNVQEWALRLDVSASTITGRWYRGSYPTADKIAKICEYAGVSADWLLAGTEYGTDDAGRVLVENIFSRAKKVLALETDADLASAWRATPEFVTRWKERSSIGLQQIINFCKQYAVSLDWMLTGSSLHEGFEELPEDIRKSCITLIEILLSEDKIVKPAIMSNLEAFRESVQKNSRLDEARDNAMRAIRELEKVRAEMEELKKNQK